MKKLEVGYDHYRITVRREVVSRGIPVGVRLLFIADTHFNGWNTRLAKRLVDIVAEEAPDLVLLGGDYVDTRGGLVSLRRLFAALRPFPTVAIMGNHDRFLGMRRVLAADPDGHIRWLEKEPVTVAVGNIPISIVACSDTITDADHRILLLHEPISPRRVPSHVDLTLAGHLHGCQVVFRERNHRLYPGAWVYRNNFTRQEFSAGQTYLITRGLADTLPVRYNCPREVLLITGGG